MLCIREGHSFLQNGRRTRQEIGKVLERFTKANLQLHRGKCFCTTQVNYLGCVLTQNGISASADKVPALKNYPTSNVRDVRSFLGLASFYRRLVPNFAELAKPLTSVTRKDHNFTLGPSQQKAFENLKERLCTTPVLAYPDFSQPFILTADASKVAVAAILSQVKDGMERPTAYASRQMNKAVEACAAS